jgi:chemotaxis protein methyltransferase WspC
MNQIRLMIRQKMGLHAATVGLSVVDRAARARMTAHDVSSAEEYAKLLRGSQVEWNALIESVVTTETWFFRDHQPFATLAQLAMEEWLPANPSGTLRLLSLPCSSGEEPYSMAMALLDAGLPAERFSIEAIDISANAISVAQRGVYRRHSFRGVDLTFRDRYFKPVGGGYEIDPAVRRQVQLAQGNLLAPGCIPAAPAYDYIFCRNLLIYFDASTQQKCLRRLACALKATGALFLGAAEVSLALSQPFVPIGIPRSFACRPGPLSDPEARVSRTTIKSALKRTRVRRLTEPSPAHPAPVRSAPVEPIGRQIALPLPDSDDASLDDAEHLAEHGRLAEAAEICEAHLRARGVSARAYYLLGRVRHAAGADAAASEFYRRALYLDPGHYDTLVHLASLSEKVGDAARARILQERALRARQAPGPD